MLNNVALLTMLFGAASAVAASNASQLQPTRGSSVLVRYESRGFVFLGEPVVVEVTVDNHREHKIQADLGFDWTENFVVNVVDPSGTLHTATLLKSCGPNCVGRRGRVVVSPLQSFSHQLVLDRWFRFDQAGIYLLELRLKSNIASDTGLPIEVAIVGRVAVEVRPRNESAIKETCERLSRTIVETTDVAQRLTSARALSYVEDPVAASYVSSVLESTETLDAAVGSDSPRSPLKRRIRTDPLPPI